MCELGALCLTCLLASSRGRRDCGAYLTVVREAKPVQVRDTDIRAFLYPRVCPNLAAQLLVNRAGVSRLRELERKRAAKEQLLRTRSARMPKRRPDRNRYAYIETTPDPLRLRRDGNRTFVLRAEVQMVSDDRSDGVALIPKLSVERLCCGNIRSLVDKVLLLVDS